MKPLRTALVALLSLFAVSAAHAQCAPSTIPSNTVVGRLGGGVAGPCQAIPFATLRAIIGATNVTTPETYGAPHDGVHDDGPAFDAAITALTATRGTLQLSCGTTYTFFTLSSNALSMIRAVSGVNIIGCGWSSSILRMANNVNTSSSFFARMIGSAGTVNDSIYTGFTIDMNGTQNSCGGTCFAFNAGIQIAAGDNITVQAVKFINNPGSNNINIASNPGIVPTTVKLIGNVHEHNGDVVNPASIDFSADFVIAANIIDTDNVYSDGPRVNGSAYELHGANITASNLVVSDHFNCGIIANETSSATTNDVNLGGAWSCKNVKSGIQVYSRAAATNTNINIHDGTIEYLSGFAGIGIDACTVIDAATGSNINLRIAGNQIKSDVTTGLGTDAPAICVGRWLSALVVGNQTYNTQGEGILFRDIANGANLAAYSNQITGAGRTANATHQIGIQVNATAATTASAIHIQSNSVTGGGVANAVAGAENATAGAIFGNLCSGCGSAVVNWSGTGTFVYTSPATSMTFAGSDIAQTFTALQRFNDNDFALVGSTSGTLVQRAPAIAGSSVIRWPAGSTDFSATGGSGQVVKQGSAGAALTVGSVAVTDLGSAGTGVLTALGINVGTAGSFVVNGGVLGTPSSGTVTNLTGTASININGTVGGSTPTTGAFTTVATSTSETVPLIAGGAVAASILTLESTSGAGTTDAIIGKTASQVERFRVTTGGLFNIGPAVTPDSLLTLNANTAASVATVSTPQLHIVGPDGANGGIAVNAYGNPVRMEMYQANGTQASKTATSATNSIFSFNGYGWNTSAYALGGAFQFVPTQTWSAGVQGTQVNFLSTPNGTAAIAVAGSFQASGGLTVGTAADPGINSIGAANVNASGAFISKGTVPVGTTGSCVASSFVGGATAGKFAAAVCAAGTIILSSLPTAPNGYTCMAQDQTTPADTLQQTSSTATSVTFKATTVAADSIVFACVAW